VINSTISGSFEIFLIDYDGNNLSQLTDEPIKDNSCPTWSPDGELISFASHAEMSSSFVLRLINADGSNISSQLHFWAGTTADCPLIDWSPDGKRIAAISRSLSILEGSQFGDVRILAECADGYPDWTPDGKRILFATDQCTNDLNQSEIYIIDVDGTGLKRLTNNDLGDYRPVWSPDGQQILFVSLRDGNCEIYIMNSDGSEQINLTKNSAEDDWPVFQP
jgi:TolB protein